MNEEVARIRMFYADGSTVLGPDRHGHGYMIEGVSTDPIGVEFLDTFDRPIVRVEIGDDNTVARIDMEGQTVWTIESGWVRHNADSEESRTPAKSVTGFVGIDTQDGEIVCEAHGMPECSQSPCRNLDWPTEQDVAQSMDNADYD